MRISASPAEVWRALREPDEIGRWFGWDYEGIGPEIQAHQAGYQLPDGSLLVVATRPGAPKASLTLSVYGS